jgi:hypothetical protein
VSGPRCGGVCALCGVGATEPAPGRGRAKVQGAMEGPKGRSWSPAIMRVRRASRPCFTYLRAPSGDAQALEGHRGIGGAAHRVGDLDGHRARAGRGGKCDAEGDRSRRARREHDRCPHVRACDDRHRDLLVAPVHGPTVEVEELARAREVGERDPWREGGSDAESRWRERGRASEPARRVVPEGKEEIGTEPDAVERVHRARDLDVAELASGAEHGQDLIARPAQQRFVAGQRLLGRQRRGEAHEAARPHVVEGGLGVQAVEGGAEPPARPFVAEVQRELRLRGAVEGNHGGGREPRGQLRFQGRDRAHVLLQPVMRQARRRRHPRRDGEPDRDRDRPARSAPIPAQDLGGGDQGGTRQGEGRDQVPGLVRMRSDQSELQDESGGEGADGTAAPIPEAPPLHDEGKGGGGGQKGQREQRGARNQAQEGRQASLGRAPGGAAIPAPAARDAADQGDERAQGRRRGQDQERGAHGRRRGEGQTRPAAGQRHEGQDAEGQRGDLRRHRHRAQEPVGEREAEGARRGGPVPRQDEGGQRQADDHEQWLGLDAQRLPQQGRRGQGEGLEEQRRTGTAGGLDHPSAHEEDDGEGGHQPPLDDGQVRLGALQHGRRHVSGGRTSVREPEEGREQQLGRGSGVIDVGGGLPGRDQKRVQEVVIVRVEVGTEPVGSLGGEQPPGQRGEDEGDEEEGPRRGTVARVRVRRGLRRDGRRGGKRRSPGNPGLDEEKSRQRPTLPPSRPDSTIGAGGLNGRVRNGNGCDPSAMVTGMNCQTHRRPKDTLQSECGAARAGQKSGEHR